jgi:pimeloyl-ACP methyl ester carboxylesterase
MKTIFCLILLLTAMNVQAQNKPKTILLVHAQWHGAWCWEKLKPILQSKGFDVITFDLPGHGNDTASVGAVTLQACVDKVVTQAQAQSGSVILLGHSSGGIVISQAAEALGREKVASLIYLDAFLPNHGESVFSLAEKYGGKGTPLGKSLGVSGEGKIVSLDMARIQELLYDDCTQEDLDLATRKIKPGPIAVLATPTRLTSRQYGAIPKYYILCTEAKDMVKSELALNVSCKQVFKLESGHSPFFSMPGKLAELIRIIGNEVYSHR